MKTADAVNKNVLPDKVDSYALRPFSRKKRRKNKRGELAPLSRNFRLGCETIVSRLRTATVTATLLLRRLDDDLPLSLSLS
jgi:hypothetical protein